MRRRARGENQSEVDRLEALTVAAVASARLGNPPGAAYQRACEVAEGLGFTDLPPLELLVERYMDGPWSVDAWYAPAPRRDTPRRLQ